VIGRRRELRMEEYPGASLQAARSPHRTRWSAMPTALPDLQTLLGDRYHLEREIGRGGMATVYLATDRETDKPVAVKVLHSDLGTALGPERFRREIDVASHLSHPHILAIEAFGGSGDFLWYVMPFVEGESLADRLKREGMLSLEDAVRITCQVARALDHAHRQGVIHRDIKPDNILLDNGDALLADFGIARAISESGDERLTKTGLTIGTPTYMSPEQAVAERNLDGRSDVYSLGCVLYEMLAGTPPFVGPSMQVIIARHTLDTVPSLTVARETVPDEVEDAVLRALAKLPADRFATAGEFADALEASMKSGGTSLGRRSGAGSRGAGRWTRGPHSPPRPPRRPRGRRRMAALIGAAVTVVLLLAGAAWKLWAPGAAGAAGEGGGLSPKRIAVLYFEDLSADRSLAALGDGLTEELIGTLGAVQGLDVVSRNGVAPYRDADVPADSVADVLGAGTLVRGSVEPSGDAVRVTVRLIDGASGADYKRATFAVPAARALAARDSVVDQVARFLRERVGDEVRLRETRAATGNSEAWGLALQGEKLLKTAEGLDRADDSTGAGRARLRADSMFLRAAALDARWPTPLVGRGRVALAQARGVRSQVEAAAAVRRARDLAQQAVQLDASNADALALRGTARLELWTRHLEPDPKAAATLLAEAEADLKRATALAPGNALAWSNLARVYYEKPNLIEATLATRRGVRGGRVPGERRRAALAAVRERLRHGELPRREAVVRRGAPALPGERAVRAVPAVAVHDERARTGRGGGLAGGGHAQGAHPGEGVALSRARGADAGRGGDRARGAQGQRGARARARARGPGRGPRPRAPHRGGVHPRSAGPAGRGARPVEAVPGGAPGAPEGLRREPVVVVAGRALGSAFQRAGRHGRMSAPPRRARPESSVVYTGSRRGAPAGHHAQAEPEPPANIT
jgi:serine/threonine-protein kinase